MTLLVRCPGRQPPISGRRLPRARKKVESKIELLKIHAHPDSLTGPWAASPTLP